MHIENTPALDLRTAIAGIYDRNREKWRRFVMTIVKNREDAEDVLQEAVQRVLIRNLTLPSQDQVRMYLGRVIGNAALELYNTRKRERWHYISMTHSLQRPAHTLCPHALLEDREWRHQKEYALRILHHALNLLSKKQYESLHLTLLNERGLSIRDAGTASGIPYSTLRHRNRQGIKMLKKYLRRALREKNLDPKYLCRSGL